MLNSTDYFPAIISWLSWYSLLCKRNEHAPSVSRQIWAFVCPSPQSSLTTGPRFVETPAMTALGGYVTGTREQVCVVPKLRRVIALCKTLLPREKKSPIDWDDHRPWEFVECPPQSKGRDGCMHQMGINTALLETNCQYPCWKNPCKMLIPKNTKSIAPLPQGQTHTWWW